jgi:3-oxoadipate enol-lactonase
MTTPLPPLMVPTPLGALAVHVAGAPGGPTALLWPSLFSDGQFSWGAQLAAMDRLGWHTLTVDPYGTGSSAPARRRFTMEECAAAALDVLNHAGVQRAAILGLSWGGFVALRMAAIASQRVSGLVLSNTSARRMRWLQRHRDTRLAELVRWGVPGRPGRLVARQMLSSTTIRRDPELALRLAELVDGLDPVGLSYAMRSVLADRTDIVDQLDAINVPTLVIDGARDRNFSRAHSRELADRIRGANLEVLPEAGHLAPREAADTVTALITSFLAELNPQAIQRITSDQHGDSQ